MLCQLISILIVLPAIIRAATISKDEVDDALLNIMKKHYQENNKPLVATLNSSKVGEETLERPRGFGKLTKVNGTEFCHDLINQLTMDEKKKVIGLYKNNNTIDKEDLMKLPIVWQYLTLKQTYSPETAENWKEIVKGQNPDLSLLYKLGQRMLLMEADTDVAVEMLGLLKPPFEQHFQFLGSHLQAEFMKFLTMDKIIGISKNESESAVKMAKTTWYQMKPGQQEAWYTLFKSKVKDDAFWANTEHVVKYGHVLGGAPLEDIIALDMNQTKRSEAWLNIMLKTESTEMMNPLRMQVAWDLLNKDEMASSFSKFADKLDLAQIQKYHTEQSWLAHEATHEVEKFAFDEGKEMPFENILLFSKLHDKDINDIKKLVVGLTIPELKMSLLQRSRKDELYRIEEAFVNGIVSHRFTHGQIMVLYNITIKANKLGNQASIVKDMPSKLLPALPSSVIENIDDISRINDLIKASSLMLQSQMSALHKIIRPKLWEKDTLKMILDSHPQCLEASSPAQFRSNISLILEALSEVETTEDGELEMARKLRNLPREFQTSWLEAAFEESRDNKYWNTSRLLERRENMRTAIIILGLNCQQIKRIRPSDTMSVLTAYQYLTEIHEMETGIPAHIPRHVRKCWAKKMRTYLKMKSMLMDADVSREVDLLSMLNTAEIKTIGGEILLTWGVNLLMAISHEKVRNEVIKAVGALPPGSLINNAANFAEVKSLANFNVPDSLNLADLSRSGNFFPYIDGVNEKVDSQEFKLFVQSLGKHQKCICVNTTMRDTLRSLILTSFGQPENLSALDLAQLGDLLIVFNEDDFNKVNSTNLRRANSQLVKSTSYHLPVHEFLRETKPIPFHEACSRWLGENDASEFEVTWRRLSQFYTYASYLAVETILNGTLSHVRRKREAPTLMNEYAVFTNITQLLRHQLHHGLLTENQKQGWGKITNDGQSALARETLKALNIKNIDKTSSEVSKIVAEKKEEKSITEQQSLKISEIAKQLMLKMVQELVKEFDFTEKDLHMTTDEFKYMISRNTTLVEASYDLYEDITKKSNETNPIEFLDVYQSPEFQQTLSYNLSTVNEVKCNVLRTAGKGAFGLNSELVKKLDKNCMEACLETIGSLLFDKTTAHSVWLEVKEKVFPSNLKITGDEMILLGSLLPTIAQFNLEMLDLSRSSLEGISLLGRYLYEGCYGSGCDFSEVPAKVIQEYVEINKIDNFTSVELESFGQLLCGLSAEDWDNRISSTTFSNVKFIFNRIDCKITDPKVRAAMEKKVLSAYNSPSSWTPSDVSYLGWLIGSLSPQQLVKIKPESMEGVSGVAVRMWTPQHWKLLTAEHLQHTGPHAMSHVDEDSLPREKGIIYLEKKKRLAIRSVVSEGSELKQNVDKLIKTMDEMDSKQTNTGDAMQNRMDVDSSAHTSKTSYHSILFVAVVTIVKYL